MAAQAEAKRIAAEQAVAIVRERRAKELLHILQASGCKQEAIDLLYIAGMKPVKTSSDVPSGLAQRLDVCLRHNLIAPENLSKIKAKGLGMLFDGI